MLLHSSVLAWRAAWTEESMWLKSRGTTEHSSSAAEEYEQAVHACPLLPHTTGSQV